MRRPHRVKLPGPTWYLRDFSYSTASGIPGYIRSKYYISATQSLTDLNPRFLAKGSTPELPMISTGAVLELPTIAEVMKFVNAAGATLVDERIGPRV